MNKKWSYSRWSTFDKCPAQYKFNYLDHLPREKPGPALARGLHIHKLAENYVNGIITGLPKELEKFKKEFRKLKKIYDAGDGFTEPDVSLNSLWKQTNREQSDFFVGFIDFIAFFPNAVVIIDYKTGRQYPGHRDQAHVYAMASMVIDENVQNVTVEFWYLDSGETQEWTWTRDDLKKMKDVWVRRVNNMYDCTDFKKIPNKFCGWCSYSKKKGGQCEH